MTDSPPPVRPLRARPGARLRRHVRGARRARRAPGRDVAIKVLRADLARDPQFQVRFRARPRTAAALNHPAIVAVYDTGETWADDIAAALHRHGVRRRAGPCATSLKSGGRMDPAPGLRGRRRRLLGAGLHPPRRASSTAT